MGGVRARAVSAGGPLPVPRSKFGCPAVPVRAIARSRLGEVLAQPDWRVALVTGGPATGKTVSVAQWFQTLDPIAREWVTLDAHDERPERFWLTFVLALDRAVPGAFARTAASATDVHRLPPEFLDRLLTAWSAVTDPLVIVLEDMHHVDSPEISEDLGFVVEHLPGGSRMLLTSRVEPRLPVSRWRGRGWLAEIRQRDLALTLPETAELFTALGEHRLAGSEIETLWRHTEGWVAGLRLAAAGLKDRADAPAAVAEFSGRTPMVADLLADELLHRAPRELSEFLLRTSVADVLDAGLCDALSGRSDSAEVLRRMEADLQFVMATGPGRDTWRYHPLLAEMLRAELQAHRPGEAQELNRLAAVILQARGDIAGAARCLLAAGDTDRAFSIVFEAAYRRADVSDIPGIAAFVNLFPRELVTESASRMLTYALILGLAGQVAEAHAWLHRAQMRISEQPQAQAKDVATADALRLLTFTATAGAGDEIDAGHRAVEAVEAGLDLGHAGARTRMNLVRGYLLTDQPDQADAVLRAGSPGDEIAALVLAPALAARIAVRHGRLSEAGRQATAALEAAGAFGVGTHLGAVDAHLALAGVRIDRNELADAIAAFRCLDEILQANPFARVYQVLVQLEKARVAAALDDFDDVFAILREAGKVVAHLPRSALRCLVDAAAARWHLAAGQTRQAEGLIAALAEGSPAHTLLRARLDLACGRFDEVKARLGRASPGMMRDQVAGELLLARAAIESGDDAAAHVSACGRARGPRASGPRLSRRGPGGGPPGPGGRGIARDRVRRQPVGGAGFPSTLPRHPASAGGDPHRARAAGAAVPALAPQQRRDRPRMPDVGEHGQGAPEEHLRQAGGRLARGHGRAGPPARPALTGNA